MTAPRRILILMSDTGGGHRSAAEAITAALAHEFPNRYAVTLVDVFRRAAIFPLNHAPDLYLPFTTYFDWLWGLGFRVSNNQLVTRIVQIYLRLSIARRLRAILCEHNPDLVVSTHPIFVELACRALRETGSRVPFVTVVTDLFDAHCFWFDPAVDLCIVPTEGTRNCARQFGMPDGKLRVVGEPLNLEFIDNGITAIEARCKLGLAPDRKTILLVGGGEGMGPLYQIARTLDRERLPIQLVVIAGRNRALYKKLCATTWQIPVSVQGFVTNMPEWMRAADALITKAGPGTISEALAYGLPIILSGFLPGQETGNVTFVEQNGVGVLRKNPQHIARTLREWLTPGNDTLTRLARRAQALARPRAALDIAQILDDLLTTRGTRV